MCGCVVGVWIGYGWMEGFGIFVEGEGGEGEEEMDGQALVLLLWVLVWGVLGCVNGREGEGKGKNMEVEVEIMRVSFLVVFFGF
jgi:hypothetical protein